MTIQDATAKVTRTGNGSATSFSFAPIVMQKAADILVVKTNTSTNVETTLTEGTGASNYSVTLTSSDYPSTGSIVYPASGADRLSSSETVTIKRNPDITQDADLENQGGYYPDTVETALDRGVMISMSQQEDIDRSLKGPITDTVSVEMPSQSERASKFLTFDSSGVPTASAGSADGISVSPFMATVLDDTSGAAALATMGMTSYGISVATAANAAANLTLLGIGSASASAAGLVELATTAETTTGTDATRAVTPDGLHDMTSLAGAAWFLDEDAMGSNSATQVASQQSIKAYVTASIAAISTSAFTLASPQATTSGTSIDFTSIPSGTKVITINFSGVSTNGSSDAIIQIGDSGGVETSGYTGCNVDSSQSAGVDFSAGFILDNLQAAGNAYNGSVTLTLLNSSSNIWAMTGVLAKTSYVTLSAGVKTLSAELDRVRLTTTNGSDTFDAGSVNILYGS